MSLFRCELFREFNKSLINPSMSFATYQIRAAHVFKHIFISQRHTSTISRAQVVYLCYLVESGFTDRFKVRQTMIPGLSWELSWQYLKNLERIGYAVKSGRYWTITPAARDYYRQFMQEFNRVMNEPLKWR